MLPVKETLLMSRGKLLTTSLGRNFHLESTMTEYRRYELKFVIFIVWAWVFEDLVNVEARKLNREFKNRVKHVAKSI